MLSEIVQEEILRMFGPDMAVRSDCGEKIFRATGLDIFKPGPVDLMKALPFAANLDDLS